MLGFFCEGEKVQKKNTSEQCLLGTTVAKTQRTSGI